MDILSHIQQLKPAFKPTSLKTYASHLTTTHKALYGTYAMDNATWLSADKDKVIEYLGGLGSPHTRRNKLNAMLLMLSGDITQPVYKEYETLRDGFNNALQKDSDNHKKSEKQEKNWVTKAEIDTVLAERFAYLHKRKIMKMKVGEPTQQESKRFHDFLLLKTIAELPSRCDFHSLEIVKRANFKPTAEDTQNYLVIGHRAEIVVNSWKTKKAHSESRVLSLSDDLKKYIRSYVKQYPEQKHLFVDASGNAFKRNSFTKRITRLFKEHFPDKDIAPTMLRHIYATEKNGDIVDALEDDAKKLGHSVSTHLQYIKK